jgi:hypothetical protein
MKKEVIEKLTALIVSAFGLVAALAWNDAINNLIQNSFLSSYGPWIYAGVVTILAVFVTIWLGRISNKIK